MTNGTRFTWILAALAVAAGASELAARGVAPHTQAMLGSDPGRAALRAGTIVARNLSDLAAEQARRAAGALVLGAVRGTTRLQRLALCVLETAGAARTRPSAHRSRAACSWIPWAAMTPASNAARWWRAETPMWS